MALLLGAFGALSARLFVFPARDTPQPADAVVVLGGTPYRVPKGLALVRAGWADHLVVSTPYGAPCPAQPPGVTVTCFAPDPSSTQGEARYVGELARRRGWRRIIVVSSIPQDTRARLRFQRCFAGEILMVPVGPTTLQGWAYDLIYEWGALAKAVVWQRSC